MVNHSDNIGIEGKLYDIAIIGGSMGGVAAAIAACEAGRTVVLTEESAWLGGQMTSQGVSAFDEHHFIEQFGGTAAYYRLRQGIRQIYQTQYGVAATMPDGKPLNPGNGWVSSLCFEPTVGMRVLEEMLAPFIAQGTLTVLRECVPVATAVADNGLVQSVTVQNRQGQTTTLTAAYFLDATDLGDLLPLSGTEYVTGAESRAATGEPQAEPLADPTIVQGFTYCFFVEYCPGEDHTIPKPAAYEAMRDKQPYTLNLIKPNGEPYPFRVFEASPVGNPPFWTYRRVLDGRLLDPSGQTNDVALINWESNDYHWANIIDVAPEERARALAEAKQLSLGFLYWLQTEVPRDDGTGYGYPELKLRPDLTGTRDGLSQFPYIRESRRIVAHSQIVEQDVAARAGSARATPFTDSVGIGWYAVDVHKCVNSNRHLFSPTRPFQIPLGALLPKNRRNLLAACKNIGVTHITNGCYRLHPIEWNIGEAAGALAAFCLENNCTPTDVWYSRQREGTKSYLRRFQKLLLARGVPLAWAVDVPQAHEDFVATQMLLLQGVLSGSGWRSQQLMIEPEKPLAQAEKTWLAETTVFDDALQEKLHQADISWHELCQLWTLT